MLLIIGQVLDFRVFLFVNQTIRLVYLYCLPPLLQIFLGNRWVARHSSTYKNNYFNVAFSDLDLSLIYCAESQYKDIETAIRKYKQLKKVILFLGELEVYTEVEFEQKCLLEMNLFVQHIYLLRKISWLKKDIKNNKSSYHVYKAYRSLKKSKYKLKQLMPLSNYLSKYQQYKIEMLDKPDKLWVDFFEVNVGLGGNDLVDWIYICISPNIFHKNRFILQKERRQVLAYEFYKYVGYKRFETEMINYSNDWILNIKNELEIKSRALEK